MHVRNVLKSVFLAGFSAGLAGVVGAGQIESVTFTGGQYVDTTVALATNLVISCDFQLLDTSFLENEVDTSALGGIFGSLAQTSEGLNVGWGLRAHGQARSDDLKGRWGAWTGSHWVALTENVVDAERHTIELRNGQVTFDESVYTTEPALDPASGQDVRTFKIGDDGWGGGHWDNPKSRRRMRFFSLKFWADDGGTQTLIADYVPWEQDGFYGIYDKQSNTFCKQIGGENILNGVWSRRPSITPTEWNRRDGVVPTVDCGEATGEIVCSHTAEQLAALPVGRHPVTFTAGGDVITIPVTVSDPFRCEVVTGEEGVRTVNFTFAPADEARSLVFVYGPSDAGADRAAWDHEVQVEVPAGVDHLDGVPVPSEIGEDNPVWRVFLPEPRNRWTASSYVDPDSLIAQFDGIENAGYGVHDGTRWYPAELKRGLTVTGYGNLNAGENAFEIGNPHSWLTFNSPVLRKAINEGHATVEVVLSDRDDVEYMHNGGIFCAGDASRGFWVYQKSSGIIGDLSYHAKPTGQYDVFNIETSGEMNTWSYLLGANSDSSACLRNGIKVPAHSGWDKTVVPNSVWHTGTISRFGTDMTDDIVYVGVLPGDYISQELCARARVHSVRVYNRVLTADEVKANAAVDFTRFVGPADEGSDVFYEPVPLTVKKVNRVNRIPVSARVVFTGSTRVRELWAVWGSKDAGADPDAWMYRAKSCDVPAGATILAEAPIPEAAQTFLSTQGGFRFVLRNKSATASDYVGMDDLLAQWDGVENAGYGIHDSSRDLPVELRTGLAVSKSGLFPHDNRSFWLGENYFSFISDDIRQAVNGGNATVEMVVAPNGACVNNGGIFALGNQSRGLWFYQKKDDRGDQVIADVSYHADMSGEYDMFYPRNAGSATNTFSFVCSTSTVASFFALNGVKQNLLGSEPKDTNSQGLPVLHRYETDSDALCYIGILPGSYFNNNYKGVAKVYSLRIYGRALSPAEVAANVAVDQARFGAGSLTYDDVSAFTRGCGAGLSVFIR